MAIYLRLGSPDQQGWIDMTGVQMPDGRFEVLIKPGARMSAARLKVLNELMHPESDRPPGDTFPMTGTG